MLHHCSSCYHAIQLFGSLPTPAAMSSRDSQGIKPGHYHNSSNGSTSIVPVLFKEDEPRTDDSHRIQ